MEIKLEHGFLKKCHNLSELLEDCHKMSTFMRKLERQAELFPNRYKPENYKGDGFELFVEALIKLSPVDGRIGITEYTVGDPSIDTGVDGWGIGMNGKKAAVQVKYRSNTDTVLTANGDHLSNFTSTAQFKGVDSNDVNNLLLITTAKGLHHFTNHEMFDGRVRCLGMKDLRSLVDNNHLFWNAFRKLVGV